MGIILRLPGVIWFPRWGPDSSWQLMKISRRIKSESGKNNLLYPTEILTIISQFMQDYLETIHIVDSYNNLLWKAVKYVDK